MAGRGQSKMKILENMGIERTELNDSSIRAPGVTAVTAAQIAEKDSLVPTVLYPPLRFKSLPIRQRTADDEIKFAWWKYDVERMRAMWSVKEDEKENKLERYTDKYGAKAPSLYPRPSIHYPDFPRELWPDEVLAEHKRKKNALKKPTVLKKQKVESTDSEQFMKKLQELEAKEKNEGVKDEPSKEDDKKQEEDEEDEKDETAQGKWKDMDDIEEDDEDMEESADYGKSYFDNGEEYIDGDDNALEDGGWI